ncbi:type II toxin-antitoxin system HicB family antitoxin [Egbenema bharatensis]|uniref:type II toxin-antitoxin system HicB family antitoxin n=1 Tax=Egbenema bharatensis TaxID=3463334 RepID=UPI003A88C4F2
MLSKYIQAAMYCATYEILEDDRSFYGEIPELPGVYATAETLRQCRDRLQEVLEGWILLGLHLQHPEAA